MNGRILTVALLWVILWEGRECSWLRGKKDSMVETVELGLRPASYRSCPDIQTKCWCGDEANRQQTIVNVKQCPFSTSWGSQCEPCTPSNVLCQRLDNCSRCSQSNPHAICAACPPDKHGLLCEQERPCKTPNITTEHMTIHPHVTRRGMYKLEFKCTGGRVRHGPKVIRCVKDKGTWNKEPPQCVLPMRCSTPPTSPFPFTHVKPGSLTSERAVFECQAGYVTKGRVFETQMHCEHGAWLHIGDKIECEPSPKCTSLPMFLGARPKTGTSIKSAYLSGERVDYECQDAFKPDLTRPANFSLICTDGLWDGQTPECELRGCRRLSVEHGTVTYSEESGLNQSDYASLHTTARVTCQEEFTLDDHDNVTCTHTGLWQPAVPKCIPKVCQDHQRGVMCSVEPLSPHVVAETNTSQIYPGQSVRYGCKPENTYRRLGVGHVERICLYNGTLTGNEIQCDHITENSLCKIHLPEDDSHLQFCRGKHCTREKRDTFQNRLYDLPQHVISVHGTVEFSCDSDYYCLDGNSSQDCPWKGGVITAPRCIPGTKRTTVQSHAVCGKRIFPKQPLIMGGEASAIEAWPWQAALLEVQGDQVEFLCGATLIDDVWAVTAAHCVVNDEDMPPRDIHRLRLTYGLSSSAESERIAIDNKRNEKFKVTQVIHHDKYDRTSLDNDIAVLRLKHPAQMSSKVGVVCLPDGQQPLVGGEEGVITGWGRTETEVKSPELRELPLTVLNNTECKEHFESEGFNTEVVTEGTLCAKSNSTLQDTTDGDSGGPFCVQGEDGLWVLEGIVSWGATNTETKALNRRAHVKLSKGASLLHTCSGSACHSGFTRVGHYINWIKNVTGENLGVSRCV